MINSTEIRLFWEYRDEFVSGTGWRGTLICDWCAMIVDRLCYNTVCYATSCYGSTLNHKSEFIATLSLIHISESACNKRHIQLYEYYRRPDTLNSYLPVLHCHLWVVNSSFTVHRNNRSAFTDISRCSVPILLSALCYSSIICYSQEHLISSCFTKVVMMFATFT